MLIYFPTTTFYLYRIGFIVFFKHSFGRYLTAANLCQILLLPLDSLVKVLKIPIKASLHNHGTMHRVTPMQGRCNYIRYQL